MIISLALIGACVVSGCAVSAPPQLASSAMARRAATGASPQRLRSDIEKLVSFGTRHTLSDTESATTGIGAARRWIKGQFVERTAAGTIAIHDAN